jgi:hypothetical protein
LARTALSDAARIAKRPARCPNPLRDPLWAPKFSWSE